MGKYTQKLGFDDARQKSRLRLIGLRPADLPRAGLLQKQIIRPTLQGLVNSFMGWLEHHEDVKRHLQGIDRVRIRQGLMEYLLSFGVEFEGDDYFESRIRVGLAHVWRKIPLSAFLLGTRVLNQHLINCILAKTPPQIAPTLIEFVLKVSSLDVSLVADTYRLAKVDKLVASLEDQIDQTRRYRIKAATDGLTGLANREHVLSMLESSLEAAKSQGWPLCVVVLDVDKFKYVNDTFGHPAGDAILKVLSKHLGSALRDVDLVGRYGGDEFLIVLQNAPLEIALKVADRLRQRVQKGPVISSGTPLSVTISQGVAMARKQDTIDTLIARADAALLEAKRLGRNRVVSAEAEEEAS